MLFKEIVHVITATKYFLTFMLLRHFKFLWLYMGHWHYIIITQKKKYIYISVYIVSWN